MQPEPMDVTAAARVRLGPHVLCLSVLASEAGIQSGRHIIGVRGPHRHRGGRGDEV